MFTASESTATLLIILLAAGILGWGFYRARPFGKLGIIAWLQSVVLMTPWLLFFGLFAAGIYINLVGILFLIVISAGCYIFLGKRLRAAGQDVAVRERLEKMLAANQESNSTESNTSEAASVVQATETKNRVAQEVVPIPEEDLKSIQGIFGIDTFFATETIPYQEGAIFKGNLRGEPEAVHTRLSASLHGRLGDRYRLFLVENPEGKPVVVVLPSSNDPKPATIPQKILTVILLLTTIATTL